MSDDVVFASIAELAGLYRRRVVGPVEATRLFLDRIDRFDPQLHSFITVAADHALADARTAERRLADGDDGPLVGVPIAVKDALATRGIRTTGNSRLLEHWVPDHDAAAVARLRAAGAVLVGKTNLNEFGWSLPSPDDLCPPPRNPWSPQYAAIGSSSGSGAAVSAGLVTAALGTDGGGSVRLPAGQMGLVGCKATHALISRVGSLHAGTLSNIGPLARTVEDAAILLNSLAAYDAADPDARPRPQTDYTHGLGDGIAGVRVGVPWGYIESVPVEPEVRTAFDAALADLTRLGAIISRVELPALEHARTANFVVLNGEHYLAHETVLRSHWALHGRSARLYLAQAAFLSSSDYLRAREVGWMVRRMVDEVLGDVHVLAMPTSPVVTAEAARQPGAHRRGINASFTAPFNLMGHPAFSVPCGVSAVGLPIGFQLVGGWYDEPILLRVAYAYERLTSWHTVRPPFFSVKPAVPER